MPSEISCGAVVFLRNPLKYLLLYRAPGEKFRESWDFPRGNVESTDKSEQEVARREIKEEAGITNLNFYDFRETIQFFFRFEGKTIKKQIIYLLAETNQEQIKISFEHNDYKWASYEEALQILKHKSSKEVLTKANNFLKITLKQKTLF